MVTVAKPARHPRTTPQTRRQILAEYRTSGLTQRAFCEQRGLRLSTVHGWLVDARRAERAPVTLAEITVPELDVPRAAPVSGWAAEVVLPSGLIVRLRDPLPPAALRGLLRGGRC